jgi:hypothetical protein
MSVEFVAARAVPFAQPQRGFVAGTSCDGFPESTNTDAG